MLFGFSFVALRKFRKAGGSCSLAFPALPFRGQPLGLRSPTNGCPKSGLQQLRRGFLHALLGAARFLLNAETEDAPAVHTCAAGRRSGSQTFLCARFGCAVSAVAGRFGRSVNSGALCFGCRFECRFLGLKFRRPTVGQSVFRPPTRVQKVGFNWALLATCHSRSPGKGGPRQRTASVVLRFVRREQCILWSRQQKAVPFSEHVFVLIWLSGPIVGAARRHLFWNRASADDPLVGHVLIAKSSPKLEPPGGFFFGFAWRAKKWGQKAALKSGLESGLPNSGPSVFPPLFRWPKSDPIWATILKINA